MPRIKNQTSERDDGYDIEYYSNENFVSSVDHETLKNQTQARFGILQNKIIFTIAGLVCCFVGLLGFSVYIMVSQNSIIEALNDRIEAQNTMIQALTSNEDTIKESIYVLFQTIHNNTNKDAQFHDDIEQKLNVWRTGLVLVGGDEESYGNLYFGNYPICDDGWNNTSATVACRMIGFEKVIFKNYSYL